MKASNVLMKLVLFGTIVLIFNGALITCDLNRCLRSLLDSSQSSIVAILGTTPFSELESYIKNGTSTALVTPFNFSASFQEFRLDGKDVTVFLASLDDENGLDEWVKNVFSVSKSPLVSRIYFIAQLPTRNITIFSEDLFIARMKNMTTAFPLNSHVYFYNSSLNGFLEVYRVTTNIFVQYVLNCSVNDFTVTVVPQLKRRSNFHGNLSVITAAETNDEVFKNEGILKVLNDGTVVLYRGLSISVFLDIRFILKFKEEMRVKDGMRYTPEGVPLSVSAKNLSNGITQIYMHHNLYYEEESKLIKMLQPTMKQGRIMTFFRQPASGASRNIYIAPLDNYVWLCILLSLIAIVVCRLTVRGAIQKETFNYPVELTMAALANFCMQGNFQIPIGVSDEIVCLCSLVFTMLLYVSYSTKIVVMLMTHIDPITDVNGVLQHNFELTTTHVDIPSLLTNYEWINQSIIPIENFSSVSYDMNEPLMDHRTASISVETDFYKYATSRNYSFGYICEYISGTPIDGRTVYKGMRVAKQSPFREIFDYTIIIIKERGLLFRYQRTYELNTIASCSKKHQNYRPLEFWDMVTCSIIFCTGFILSFAAAGFEKLLAHFTIRDEFDWYMS